MGKVLVDADVLVAITKLDDSNHKKALFIENILKRREVVFYFSPFTISRNSNCFKP